MSGTILIVDDVATNRIVLKVKLSAACYDTLQAPDAQTALAVARRARPDLILLDMMLPDLSGIEVCRRLKASPETRDIPVVMITADRTRTARTAALRAGADDFLPKPVQDTILMARIRSLLRAHETEAELRLRDGTARVLGLAEAAEPFIGAPGRSGDGAAAGTVALIGPDRETALGWRRALAPHLAARLVVVPAEAALAETAAAPDVYLIAADLGQPGAGLRLMSELRSRAATRRAAVCILLPDGAQDSAAERGAMALDLGAADLLLPDYDAEETALRVAAQLRRKRQADRLRASLRNGLRLAVIDPLTGLYNRRYAMPHLARLADRAAATGKPYAVMLLDLDRFKAVNDSFGHAAGDAVLAEVAQRLQASLRPVDLIARIGGEEFLVAMPEATLVTARTTAERLCRVIEALPVALPPTVAGAAGSVSVTVSIGLALGGPESARPGILSEPESAERVMARADAALLAAKAEGRNQVTIGRSAA